MDESNKRHQHRLAVVLNGGVSLAVWMGGLARELDNAKRASRPDSSPPASGNSEASQAEHDLALLWKEHFSETELVIDVLAGTSAGGLNGVLLAMASAKDVPLDSLRSLWMQAAQLSSEALLSQPSGPRTSVLSGDFFLEQVHTALSGLAANPGAAPQECDLVVTSTSLRGQPRQLRDDFDSGYTEPDHRRRFEFRSTASEYLYSVEGGFTTVTQQDFDDVSPLALAGRASASFPVAFAAVQESTELRERRTWPTWDTGPAGEWLIDGGVLDNSPFQPVLEAIARQPVSATWDRTLCYVVPSANENTADPTTASLSLSTASDAPPPWTSVASASFSLPREADFRDDVEQLHDLAWIARGSVDSKRFDLLLADPAVHATAVTLASAGLPLYRQSRAIAAVYRIRSLALGPAYYACSLQTVLESDVTASSRTWNWLPTTFPTALPTTWSWGTAAAKSAIDLMLRSLATASNAPDGLREELSDLSKRAQAVRNAVDAAYGEATLPADTTPVSIAELADTTLDNLNGPDVLNDLVTQAATSFARDYLGNATKAGYVLQAALATEVVNGAGGVPIEPRPTPVFNFIRMGLTEPPELLAQDYAVASQDTPGSNILYGTRLNHFAGFGEQKWREWDWLWGRIHGAVHLGRLRGLDSSEVNELVSLIITAEGWTVQEVRDGIGDVFGFDDAKILTSLKALGQLPKLGDSVFELLTSAPTTSPPIPGGVRSAARFASIAGSRMGPPPPDMTFKEKILRRYLRKKRRAQWDRWTGSTDTD